MAQYEYNVINESIKEGQPLAVDSKFTNRDRLTNVVLSELVHKSVVLDNLAMLCSCCISTLQT